MVPDFTRGATTDGCVGTTDGMDTDGRTNKEVLLALRMDDADLAAVCAAEGVTLTGELVGDGGYGVVRRCTVGDGRGIVGETAAAKFLVVNEKLALSGRSQEWHFLCGLQHDNVLPCLRVFPVPSPAHARRVMCMVSPLCDADLGAAIDSQWVNTAFREPPSEAERVSLAKQLTSGLAYLHENDVAHRDIKPGNILLKGRKPLIADFGISKVIDTSALSSHHTAAGTAEYEAPEVSLGVYSARADLWSLGLVLAELATDLRWPTLRLERLSHDANDGDLSAARAVYASDDDAPTRSVEEQSKWRAWDALVSAAVSSVPQLGAAADGCLCVHTTARPTLAQVAEVLDLQPDDVRRSATTSLAALTSSQGVSRWNADEATLAAVIHAAHRLGAPLQSPALAATALAAVVAAPQRFTPASRVAAAHALTSCGADALRESPGVVQALLQVAKKQDNQAELRLASLHAALWALRLSSLADDVEQYKLLEELQEIIAGDRQGGAGGAGSRAVAAAASRANRAMMHMLSAE